VCAILISQNLAKSLNLRSLFSEVITYNKVTREIIKRRHNSIDVDYPVLLFLPLKSVIEGVYEPCF